MDSSFQSTEIARLLKESSDKDDVIEEQQKIITELNQKLFQKSKESGKAMAERAEKIIALEVEIKRIQEKHVEEIKKLKEELVKANLGNKEKQLRDFDSYLKAVQMLSHKLDEEEDSEEDDEMPLLLRVKTGNDNGLKTEHGDESAENSCQNIPSSSQEDLTASSTAVISLQQLQQRATSDYNNKEEKNDDNNAILSVGRPCLTPEVNGAASPDPSKVSRNSLGTVAVAPVTASCATVNIFKCAECPQLFHSDISLVDHFSKLHCPQLLSMTTQQGTTGSPIPPVLYILTESNAAPIPDLMPLQLSSSSFPVQPTTFNAPCTSSNSSRAPVNFQGNHCTDLANTNCLENIPDQTKPEYYHGQKDGKRMKTKRDLVHSNKTMITEDSNNTVVQDACTENEKDKALEKSVIMITIDSADDDELDGKGMEDGKKNDQFSNNTLVDPKNQSDLNEKMVIDPEEI